MNKPLRFKIIAFLLSLLAVSCTSASGSEREVAFVPLNPAEDIIVDAVVYLIADGNVKLFAKRDKDGLLVGNLEVLCQQDQGGLMVCAPSYHCGGWLIDSEEIRAMCNAPRDQNVTITLAPLSVW